MSADLDLNNKINQILDEVSKIDLNKKINYSEILYYSLVFDIDAYFHILNKLLSNNSNLIDGIFKFESENEIKKYISEPDTTQKFNQLYLVDNDLNHNANPNPNLNKILKKLSPKDIFAMSTKENNTNVYKLNSKFHTTMLYTGGKEEPKALDLEDWVGKEVKTLCKSFGISDNFIVCGIEILDKSVPYYGNPIQHITIGLKITDSAKFKIFPKDSPSAFEKGVKIDLAEPFEITGKIIKEVKEVKEVKEIKEKIKKD